jgi:hypothetical protein
MGARVLICGGREFADRNWLFRELDRLNGAEPFSCVIAGGAVGADTMAREWAESRAIPVIEFKADWDGQGRKAGPIRNQRMLDEGAPDVVVAFPGGNGTEDMCAKATAVGVRVWRVGAKPSSPVVGGHRFSP